MLNRNLGRSDPDSSDPENEKPFPEKREESSLIVLNRSKNQMEWKRNILKNAVNSGQQYVNVSGKEMDAKALKPVCPPTCLYKCYEAIDEDDVDPNEGDDNFLDELFVM
jgi:hypothetical protein